MFEFIAIQIFHYIIEFCWIDLFDWCIILLSVKTITVIFTVVLQQWTKFKILKRFYKLDIICNTVFGIF